MRLTTSGDPWKVARPVVGRISTKPPNAQIQQESGLATGREDSIFLSDVAVDDPELIRGYRGFITPARLGETLLSSLDLPVIHRVRETEHLRENDIVVLQQGFIRTLYRPDSQHNTIFVTERCNSNCLMCSQPPKDRDDTEHFLGINQDLVKLIPPGTGSLGITGGEPTLLGEKLCDLLTLLKDRLPNTHLHLLTNGRLFAWPQFTRRFANVRHPDLVLGIPLYSDAATEHDYVVQAKGAFDQTVLGLHQLARWNIQVEIRIVLHRLTIDRLPQLAAYIYRTFPFVVHVALMGLEPIGYTPYHRAKLWIDPYDYQATLLDAVEYLSIRGVPVSIYNLQRCVLPKSLWTFARQSISDWKNIYLPVCDGCSERNACAGFFRSAERFHSEHIRPL
jgi:His-Xaa-Ser system radical SAM maturase HxsC